jgi:uncharacterized membrane protein YfcA
MAAVSAAEVALAILVGFASGVLAGLFGVGGGVVMTPGLSLLVNVPPVVAVETPLPVIFPTAAVGAATYWRAGELDVRAAVWIGGTGIVTAVAGAFAADAVGGQILLLVTACLLGWQSVAILRGRGRTSTAVAERRIGAWALLTIGAAAGLLSGLLGIGGGLVIVPALAGVLGMPLKRALGTSLLCIVVMVIPGTIVHSLLGHIDWPVAFALMVGSIPGARVGAKVALGTRERTLRLLVGSFLGLIAVGYGAQQVVDLVRG